MQGITTAITLFVSITQIQFNTFYRGLLANGFTARNTGNARGTLNMGVLPAA
jgi:hypothetical protein